MKKIILIFVSCILLLSLTTDNEKIEFRVDGDSALLFEETPSDINKYLKENGFPKNIKKNQVSDSYTHYTFPKGKFIAIIKKGKHNLKDKIKIIALQFANQALGHEKELKSIIKTEFGYMVLFNWGTVDDLKKDHVLNMLISIEKKMIWWKRCS